MIIKKNQIKIINLFRKNLFLEETIREISNRTGIAYPKSYDAIEELIKENVLKSKRIGNSKLCSLNLSAKTISLLSFLDEQEAISLTNKKTPFIEKILEFKEFKDDILLITGSYAKGKETSKSDIDLTIITKDNPFKKQKLMENLSISLSDKLHLLSFSYNDFIEMLLSKEANFGKEAFKYHLILRNANRFYELIKEVINNGFRG